MYIRIFHRNMKFDNFFSVKFSEFTDYRWIFHRNKLGNWKYRGNWNFNSIESFWYFPVLLQIEFRVKIPELFAHSMMMVRKTKAPEATRIHYIGVDSRVVWDGMILNERRLNMKQFVTGVCRLLSISKFFHLTYSFHKVTNVIIVIMFQMIFGVNFKDLCCSKLLLIN